MSKFVNFRANFVEFRVQRGHILLETQCPIVPSTVKFKM